VEVLRAAQGPSSIELDKLKTQLVNAKKELDKVTNAKLALERSSAREVEELKSRLEDANFELEDWRRNDGSGSKAGIENAKKAARQEVDVLTRRVDELEETIREKERALEKLPVYEAQIAELRIALDQAQAVATETLHGTSTNEASAELSERIADLEKELAAARTAAPSVALPADKTSRQLQREISKLKSQVTNLEEELAAQDDEILRLRGAVPLPGSPSLTATKSNEEIAKIALLEGELEDAKSQANEARERLEIAEEQTQALQKQLEVSIETAIRNSGLMCRTPMLIGQRWRLSCWASSQNWLPSLHE
jgi:DNA repair exonuclease SbcCD ATPase subunit